ncbi:MAG: flavin reductase family protein [Pseudomonadota bacterium]
MTDVYRPLKDAFGRYATGVAIAACKAGDDEYVAITINSFTSVSLNPPLVLWCVERNASTFPAFMAADHYSVSILRADQKDASQRFASYQPKTLTGAEIEIWETGAPILKDRLAGFDCTIHERHQAGDHVILIGRVIQFDSIDGAPLVYYASGYRSEEPNE